MATMWTTHFEVRSFTFNRGTADNPKIADVVKVSDVNSKREIEVYASPTGRSVRVFVDGVEIR